VKIGGATWALPSVPAAASRAVSTIARLKVVASSGAMVSHTEHESL